MPQAYRANSVDPRPRGLPPTQNHAAARQVQSSPARGPGSEGIPIEIDLTPKPVRRQLFPSPDNMRVCSDPGPHATSTTTKNSLPSFVRRSPRLNKTKDVFATPVAAVEVTVDGKENVAPAPTMEDDDLADLFEEGPADVELPPPMTPTPKRRSERILLKTPLKTPQRQFGAQISGNTEKENPASIRTPKNVQNQHPALTALLGSVPKNILEMTPITRSIHDALTSDLPMETHFMKDDKVVPRNGRRETPKKSNGFDFPDLPSLKNSSPMAGDQLVNFGFSEMTTDQLTSDMIDPFTNSAMPSSPPANLFKYLDAIEMDDNANVTWDSILNPNTTESMGHSTYPDPDSLAAVDIEAHALRRSPRRQQAK